VKPFRKFAKGGPVYGPAPSSDSIPVWLGGGCSYIPASKIKDRADLLEKLNSEYNEWSSPGPRPLHVKPPLGVIPGWLVKEQTGRDNLRIGFDLDGVAYNFEDSVRRYLIKWHLYDAEELPNPTGWDFHQAWGFEREDFEAVCNDGVDSTIIFGTGDPYPGTAEAMHRIKDAGHSIHIVTARFFGSPGMAQRNTMQWLAEHDIPFDTVTFARDKTVVRTDYMIEDNLGNFDALQAAGTHAVLMDRPWNQDTPDRSRSRVRDMQAFADHIVGVDA